MPYITATECALFWSVWDDTGVLANGVTPVGALTVTGKNITYGKTESELLGAAVARKEKYPPLPPAGTWLEAGDVYRYGDTLVMVRQSHVRTEHAPADVPALLLVYRPDAAGVPEWIVGEKVEKGTRRAFGGKTYQCLQPHVTQADWTPDKATALWIEVVEQPPQGAIPPWVSGEQITYDPANPAKRTYGGRIYQLRQNPGINIWPPPTVPALWVDIGPV